MDPFDDQTVCAPKARIEIIPLIDVVFFLLATFVLFTLSLQRVRVLEAELPRAGEEQSTGSETVFIHASADGTLRWQTGANGLMETITATELGPRLQHYSRTVPLPRVLLRSDREARLRAAVLVLDEVRRAGIRHVAIETRVTTNGS